MTEDELAHEFDRARTNCESDESLATFRRLSIDRDGPIRTKALLQLARHHFGMVRFDQAKALVEEVLAAPTHRYDEETDIEANNLRLNIATQLDEPIDENLVVRTIWRALLARLPDEAGQAYSKLASIYFSTSRTRARQAMDAAARCFLMGSWAAPAPGCLLWVAKLDAEDGEIERALHLVDLGLENARKFFPFATRNVRPALEKRVHSSSPLRRVVTKARGNSSALRANRVCERRLAISYATAARAVR